MSSSNTDFDAKLVDWLYGELDSDDAASFEAHLEAHPEHKAEAHALRDTRVAFQELPQAEPSTALTAMLMQQAAASVQPKEGVWSAIVAFFQPVILHPAASAMATVVLLAGVAGTLYMRNGNMVAEPDTVSSKAERPAALPSAAPPPTASSAIPQNETLGGLEASREVLDEEAEPAPEPEAVEGGYAADLASPAQEEQLRAAASRDGESRADTKLLKEDKAAAPGESDDDAFAFDSSSAANAVSGGDLLQGRKTLELNKNSTKDNARGSVGGLVSPTPRRSRAAPKGVKKPTKKAKTKAANSWEQKQVQSFQAAARKKRCRDAGRIANDLREKSPVAYDRNVKGSPEESDCSYYIASETKRRSLARAKRSSSNKKARKGQGKSVPAKAVAAPQRDEMAEPAEVQEASPAL